MTPLPEREGLGEGPQSQHTPNLEERHPAPSRDPLLPLPFRKGKLTIMTYHDLAARIRWSASRIAGRNSGCS